MERGSEGCHPAPLPPFALSALTITATKASWSMDADSSWAKPLCLLRSTCWPISTHASTVCAASCAPARVPIDVRRRAKLNLNTRVDNAQCVSKSSPKSSLGTFCIDLSCRAMLHGDVRYQVPRSLLLRKIATAAFAYCDRPSGCHHSRWWGQTLQ